MFPNGFGMNGYWGPENYVLGAALFDWHKDFDDLPEEVKEYLTPVSYTHLKPEAARRGL